MIFRHPLLVIRLQYFFYFAVLGIFLPYFNLYCYHLGFSGAQIGALSAARSMVMVVFSIIWGLLADRFHLRRPIYIVCSVLSALTWLTEVLDIVDMVNLTKDRSNNYIIKFILQTINYVN